MSTCTSASRHLDEPLAGTAATARTWLLLEQPGPWGVKALTSSHLDPALGRALEAAAEGTGVRVALIRRPGRHADCREVRRAPGVRGPHRSRERLAAQRHDAATPGGCSTSTSPPSAKATTTPSGRCCGAAPTPATPSRSSAPTASATAAAPSSADRSPPNWPPPESRAPGRSPIWAVTASRPPLLVLPFGYVYGRAEAHHVKEVLQGVREGRVVTEGCRGSSAWERPGQAAELAVRTATRRGRGRRAHRPPHRRRGTALGRDRRPHRRPPLDRRRRPGRRPAAPPGELRLRAGLPGEDGRG